MIIAIDRVALGLGLASLLVSILALTVSVVRTRATLVSLRREVALERSAVVRYFLSQYQALLGAGFDSRQLSASGARLCTQYFSLLEQEFYFFDAGFVPESIFGMWCMELVDAYRCQDDARQIHVIYIERGGAYTRLSDFTDGLAKVSRDVTTTQGRVQAVQQAIGAWRKSADGL